MRNPIEALLEWDEHRWQTRRVKDWERQRASGKWLFVLKFGFLWGLIMFGGLNVIGDFLDGKIGVDALWFNLMTFLSIGLALGLFKWHQGERNYQKYLRKISEKKPDGFPTNDALIDRRVKNGIISQGLDLNAERKC